jgi:hypothetical protein
MEPKQTKLRNNLENDLFINGIVYPNDVRMLSGFPNHATQFAPAIPSNLGAVLVERSG